MKLKPGDKAPSFQREDIFGETVSLESFKERKLMLSFYRYAACPLCNLRINELSKQISGWKERGLDTVAIFQSPVDSVRQYVSDRHDAPFSIIADPDRELYKLYSVEGSSWAGFMKGMVTRSGYGMKAMLSKGYLPTKIEGDVAMLPGDFLIGPDMVIQTAYYGSDIGDHLPIEDIEAFVEEG